MFKPLLILGAFLVLAASMTAQTAAEITDSFYAKLAELKISGLPNEAQLSEISPFLSNEIVALIKRDRQKQAAFIKKNPDEKPPWIEGDLFSSLFEGRTSYAVGKSRVVSGTTHVDVALEYADGTETSKWTDTAVLRKSGGKWRITNILYKGKWQFKSGSSLLNVLK